MNVYTFLPQWHQKYTTTLALKYLYLFIHLYTLPLVEYLQQHFSYTTKFKTKPQWFIKPTQYINPIFNVTILYTKYNHFLNL